MDASKIPARLARWAGLAAAMELATGVDGLLLLAVMDRESFGGDRLTPPGPAGTGDHGHGRGLMQIDDRWHKDFIAAKFDGGPFLWTLPAFNMLYAASLLRKAYDALGGWDAALAAYNAGLGAAKKALVRSSATGRLEALDRITTGSRKKPTGDYVSDVLERWRSMGGGNPQSKEAHS